ncbi:MULTISPECIES: RHS repeat-associated core domain-containing protein [Streptomyces]|uniref:RHS repeat-associated core domain-containing protein n=1 Tax=Streptomyces TaxID=1883 RepID=UPI00069BDF2C
MATTSATGDVELQFANVHGDMSVTPDTAMTAPKVLLYDEFGVPTDGQAPQRYGWLGAKQRSGEALGGVILMGARIYSPALGRFLQMNADPGGNADAYDYCSADPVNCVDLDGHWGFSFKNNHPGLYAQVRKLPWRDIARAPHSRPRPPPRRDPPAQGRRVVAQGFCAVVVAVSWWFSLFLDGFRVRGRCPGCLPDPGGVCLTWAIRGLCRLSEQGAV